MSHKRIVLVVDNPARDLLGIACLTYWLAASRRALPIVVGTKNEITGLVKHLPHALLMSHVRFERHAPLIDYAKSQGTALALLPAEGLPKTDTLIPKTVLGAEKFRPSIDLFMSWGDYVASYCRQHKSAPNAEIETVGCPRFDVHTPAYDALYPTRDSFLRELELEPTRPTITWFSCTAYANYPLTEDQYRAALNDPTCADSIVGKDLDLIALFRDNQRVYTYMSDLFARFVQSHPEYNYLVKPHPFEPAQPYRDRLLPLSPRVRILSSDVEVAQVTRASDVQVNWRCTTSLEGWMHQLDKRTISVQTPGIQTSECLRPMVEGNDCVVDYGAFTERIERYLAGESVPRDLIERRKSFIQNFATDPGSAGRRSAETLLRFLDKRKEPQRQWRHWRYIARKQVPHWLRYRRWAMQRRGPEDPKYFSPALFQRYIDKYNRVFSTDITPRDYRIEA